MMRQLLFVICLILCSGSTLGSAEDLANGNDGPIHFIVLSDLHMGLNETNNTYKMFHYNEIILLDLVAEINEMKNISFVLVAGDLTRDSEPYNHKKVLEILGSLRVPYYITPGNHDVSKKGLPADAWGENDLKENYPMPWNEDGLSFSADPVPGVHLVSLDSASAKSHHEDWGGATSVDDLKWLAEDLEKNKGKTTILITHHSLNHHHGADHPLYYNDNSSQIKQIMNKYGVHLAITGHAHITDCNRSDSLTDMSCPATCSYPCAYTICQLLGDELRTHVVWYGNEAILDIAKKEFSKDGMNLSQAEGEPSDRDAMIMLSAPAEEKLVIAHRGASGYLPEHTLEAYAMAYGMGADYVEPDLVLTKDGVFICLHDTHLERTTDVEDVFPKRAREDGRWYAADFNLSEIKQLHVQERTTANGTSVFCGRFPQNKSDFEIPTFTEMIELIQGLNRAADRNVGIYPEIKSPAWHAAEGLPMEEALLEILSLYGYQDQNSSAYVQCFENQSLKIMRNQFDTKLRLIQLIDTGNNSDTGENYSSMVTKEGLKEISTYADGIGPYKMHIEANPKLVEWAHEEGLQVHTWTMRADLLPKKYQDFTQELNQFYCIYGVDGLFTDFTDQAVSFLHEGR